MTRVNAKLRLARGNNSIIASAIDQVNRCNLRWAEQMWSENQMIQDWAIRATNPPNPLKQSTVAGMQSDARHTQSAYAPLAASR